MLVAGVQSIVSTFDKYLPPLDEAGRQETSHHANDDFLGKRRVHLAILRSRSGAIREACFARNEGRNPIGPGMTQSEARRNNRGSVYAIRLCQADFFSAESIWSFV
jgi:hypothetical protein